MGLMDTLKGLLKGREQQAKQGIDTVSDQVEKRVGPEHAAKVDNIADKAKDHVDKLSGGGAPAAPAASTAPPVAAPRPATPPTTSPGAPPPVAPPV